MSQGYPFQQLPPTVSPGSLQDVDNLPGSDPFFGADDYSILFGNHSDQMDPYHIQNPDFGYLQAQPNVPAPSLAGSISGDDYFTDQQHSTTHSSDSNQTGGISDGYYSAEENQAQESQIANGAPAEQPFPPEVPYIEFEYVGVNARSRTQQYGKTKKRRAALNEAGQLQSKRAERRAKIVEKHGSVSSLDMPKGTVREKDGGTEWLDPVLQKWCLAAPLDDYRHQIIFEDSALGPYDFPPDHGVHVDDVTTFPLDDRINQRHWHLGDRSSWGNIQDTKGNQVMYLLERPNVDIELPSPGFMMYGNVIMLDPDDHPIINWPYIPRCFSSQVEGGRVEALRRIFPWLSLSQFRARMPRRIQKRNVGTRPLFGHSGMTQRLSRFRESYDCPPWKKSQVRMGTDQARHTKARLAQEGLDPHSTAGLMPISNEEVLRRKQPHKGKFPEKLGIYTLTEEEQKTKDEREAARMLERYKQNENFSDGHTQSSSDGTKRKREYDDAFDGIDQASTKRQCLPSGTRSRSMSESLLIDPRLHTSPRRAVSFSAFSSNGPDVSTHFQLQSPRVPSMPGEAANQGFNIREPKEESAQATEIDIRGKIPQTNSEQVSIKTALSYTIADYRYFHGKNPPSTKSTDSYITQYQQLQDHHRNQWFLPYLAPQLIGISMWPGSFSSIPGPSVDEGTMQRLLLSSAMDEALKSDEFKDWCTAGESGLGM